MDYNFNLKHSSQRKLNMSPILQPPNLERCFSTSSRLNIPQCMSNKLKMNPIINFISGLHTQANSCSRSKSLPSGTFTSASGLSVSSLPSGPFVAGGMSVSCFVGGFGGSDNSMTQTTQQYCDNIFLDVLLNECLPFERTPQSTAQNQNSCTTNINSTQRRTYAEVTKEKPRPRNAMNCVRSNSVPCPKRNVSPMDSIKRTAASCDSFTVLRQSHTVQFTALNPQCSLDRLLSVTKVSSGTHISPGFTRLKSCSTSSDSSSEFEKNIPRTLSECSAESDDSFIIFHGDDNDVDTVLDYSEESSDDDDTDEVSGTVSSNSEKVSATPKDTIPPDKKKVVRWAENLVKVHRLVTWDFASRAARPGPWEQFVRDRDRFQNRLKLVSTIISPILDQAHREAVYAARFMPT